jgi:ribonuclease Z
MKLQFLGTSSGKTSLKNFHTSFMLSNSESGLLIDAGDGISKAMLNAHKNFNKISAVFITHCHSDHFCGLPSLLTQMIMEDRTESLKIIINQNLEINLISLLRISNIFIEQLSFAVELVFAGTDKWFSPIDNVEMLIRQNSHITNKYFEAGNVPGGLEFFSSSVLIKTGGKTIFYTSDVGDESDLYLFDDFKIDYLITESAHVTLKEIQKAAEQINPEKIILTHIPDELREELDKTAQMSNFIVSDDKMTLKM